MNKILIDETAVKLALEALESCYQSNTTMYRSFDKRKTDSAITTIKEALAQPKEPEQEPVAHDNCRAERMCHSWCGNTNHWRFHVDRACVLLREELKGNIMAKKLTIADPAIKEKKTGKVDPAPSKAWSHEEIEVSKGVKDKNAKRGFVTNTGKFVDRKKAAKIAKKAGEVSDKSIKKLHSHDLREAAGIAKKKLK